MPEEELRAPAQAIQDRAFRLRNLATEAVVGLIPDLAAARAGGRPDGELQAARDLQRRTQLFLDFVEAESSAGFHAPAEAARILACATDLARQGQIALRDPKFTPVAGEQPPRR